MNRLPLEKRYKIIQLLVEGNSIRSCSRILGVSKCTIQKLLVEVGAACIKLHDDTVIGIRAKHVECDEIWSFVHSKQKNTSDDARQNGAGDVWTWIGMDADSKLIITMSIKRFARRTNAFSKKIKNHCCAIALHFAYYNFVRVHQTLRVTPAMRAGLSKRFWSIEDLLKLTDK